MLHLFIITFTSFYIFPSRAFCRLFLQSVPELLRGVRVCRYISRRSSLRTTEVRVIRQFGHKNIWQIYCSKPCLETDTVSRSGYAFTDEGGRMGLEVERRVLKFVPLLRVSSAMEWMSSLFTKQAVNDSTLPSVCYMVFILALTQP